MGGGEIMCVVMGGALKRRGSGCDGSGGGGSGGAGGGDGGEDKLVCGRERPVGM